MRIDLKSLPRHPTSDDEFRSAVTRLLTAALGSSVAQSSDLEVVRTEIRRVVRSKARTATDSDAEDMADQAIARFVTSAYRVDPSANPAGYLVQTALHIAIDFGRSRAAEQRLVERLENRVMNDPSPGTEELLQRMDSQSTVRQAIRDAVLAEDIVASRVLTSFLDLASSGRAPSLREVARRAGVSHVAVMAAYRRIAKRLRPSY
jgi:DNA-directed RNA polymerase specialized sigma24 family protein